MSIAVEFQTDLISFGKTVLQYHTYDKDMIFNENDYVIFTSSSGRSLEGFLYTRTNLSLQNTTSLLITCKTHTYTKFQLIQPTDVFQEIFLIHSPCDSSRRETCPFVPFG